MLNKLKELQANREEGFTLIELLVVIVIIGVLAAIALPIFLNQQKAAIAASVKSDVRNTVGAVATYLVNHPTENELYSLDWEGVALGGHAADGSIKIVKSVPATKMEIYGSWNTYIVRGSNENIEGYYVFDSTTGKYEGIQGF